MTEHSSAGDQCGWLFGLDSSGSPAVRGELIGRLFGGLRGAFGRHLLQDGEALELGMAKIKRFA